MPKYTADIIGLCFYVFQVKGLNSGRKHTILIDKRARLNDSTTSCAHCDIKDEVE